MKNTISFVAFDVLIPRMVIDRVKKMKTGFALYKFAHLQLVDVIILLFHFFFKSQNKTIHNINNPNHPES